MKSLEFILYNSKQRVLNNLSKWNYLDEHTSVNSENDNSDLALESLLDYKVYGKMDKRLLQNMERKEPKKKSEIEKSLSISNVVSDRSDVH